MYRDNQDCSGAPYREKKVFGSLTLGGYDESRIKNENLTLHFGPDQSRDFLVGIQEITQTTRGGTTELLPKGILAAIDSGVSQIWLPIEACQRFERAFHLAYDVSTDLYLVNDSLHETLLAQDAEVTFILGDNISGGANIRVTLPYASFDLTAEYPLAQNSTRYFPLKRAANDTQYTLGRTFLQEAYLIADYERQRFTVSQVSWNASSMQNIIPICPVNVTDCGGQTQNDPNESVIAKGAIAGIVVGALVGSALICSLTWYFIIRPRQSPLQKHRKSGDDQAGKPELDASLEVVNRNRNSVAGVNVAAQEIDGLQSQGMELHGQSRSVFELHGDDMAYPEMGVH
jgi:hypothetical protein